MIQNNMNRLTSIFVALCISVVSLVAQQTAHLQQLIDSAQYTEAVQLCTMELRQYPKNGELYHYRIYAYALQEQYGKALQDFDMLIKYAKTSTLSISQVYRLRGLIYEEIGEYSKALADYTTAIKKDKKNADVYAQRGELYYRLQDYTAALADYRMASKLSPTDDDYMVEIARCTLSLGDLDETRAILSSIRLLYPHNAEAWRMSALLAMFDDKTTVFIDQYIRYLNLNYSQTGEWADIDCLIVTASTEYPYLLNAVSEQITSQTGAVQAFYQGVRVRIYMAKQYYTDAIKELNILEHSEYSSMTFVLANRAECYTNLYQYKKALGDYSSLLQLDVNSLAVYRMLRGRCYQGMGDYSNAIMDFSDAILEEPSIAYYGYYMRAIAQAEQKQYDEALPDLSRSIELNPLPDAYMWRGRLYLIKGDTTMATADFRHVLAEDSTFSSTSCRPFALHYLGYDAEALAWADSITATQADKGTYYNVACLYSLAGRSEQALNALEKALALGYRDFQHIYVDADLDNICKLPRFEELLKDYRQKELQATFNTLQMRTQKNI